VDRAGPLGRRSREVLRAASLGAAWSSSELAGREAVGRKRNRPAPVESETRGEAAGYRRRRVGEEPAAVEGIRRGSFEVLDG